MKKIMEQMAEDFPQHLKKQVTIRPTEKLLFPTDRTYVNISVTVLWQVQKHITKAPFMIADDVVAKLADSQIFSMAEVVKPGFINLKVTRNLLQIMNKMAEMKLSVKKQRIRRRSLSITADQTLQNHFMSDISVLQSSVRVSSVSDVL